jgi:alpha-tubulin suppressor-like RCC1 family protein
VLVWGSNERGQLGLGKYEDVFSPQKIDTFSRGDMKITQIAAGGYLNLACTE